MTIPLLIAIPLLYFAGCVALGKALHRLGRGQ